MWLALFLIAVPAGQDPATFRQLLLSETDPVVRNARQAVTDFERGRRHHLPIKPAGGGRCDERMGRFCYWYDEADTALPREPEPVRKSRQHLLETLRRAQIENPSSDWVLGQRIRYLLEQDLADSAAIIASRCGSTYWWCLSLLGLVDHTAGRFAAADSSFRLAVDLMPEEVGCAWHDWGVALGTDLENDWSRLPCATRAALDDSLFWLGQPLLSRPGNDLRTELFARRVMAALHEVSLSPHLIPWGDDLEEMMLRYGWSTHWSVAEAPIGRLDPPSVTGHQRAPAYWFFPTRTGSDSSWQWDLRATRPPSRYGPAYADRIVAATDVQIARFPRGDSTIVVGAMSPTRETALASGPFAVSLAASPGPGMPTAVRTVTSEGPIGPVVLTTASVPRLIGIEASRPGGRIFLRGRVWYPEDRRSSELALSDPLLFAVADDLPANLDQAAAKALPGTTVSKAVPVGVYWEAHGPGADSVDVAVAVIPIRRGLLGRIGERLSLVKRRAPLTLQWHVAGDAGAIVGRAFELDLRRLKTGRYFLRLDATSRGQTASTGRQFELTS